MVKLLGRCDVVGVRGVGIPGYDRSQLPLLPAFCITDYKSQGKTLPKVILDLESAHSIQSAYVMLS
ncbi:uncharacterized protein EI90DRAFT_2912087 [Cantharellus anzutake]|uniref:uncharacterized protein n=1 Tax=Cantharellus anzutake TaxID=1750568 RepID=UPI001904610D|nr:uncharacterized protein EI90DRAFT_2912087 [Cantharellus anzutake]KAF8336600.1 hypothetical protein EI90DRAFT_2912087 [Cantharellus anzutake]